MFTSLIVMTLPSTTKPDNLTNSTVFQVQDRRVPQLGTHSVRSSAVAYPVRLSGKRFSKPNAHQDMKELESAYVSRFLSDFDQNNFALHGALSRKWKTA